MPTWSGSGESPLLGYRQLTSHCILTRQKKNELALWPLLREAQISFLRAPPYDLITHLDIPTHWKLDF